MGKGNQRLKIRNTIRRKGSLFSLALSPFVIFLIGLWLIYRILTVVPVVWYPKCEYTHFWVHGWHDWTSVLQLILVIPFLTALVCLVRKVTYQGQWVDFVTGLGFSVLLFCIAVIQYAIVFPNSTTTRLVVGIEEALYQHNDLILFEPWRQVQITLDDDLQTIVDKVEATSDFANRDEKPFYLIVRDDFSYELVMLPDQDLEIELQGSYPSKMEILHLEQCMEQRRKFTARVAEIESDDTIIFLRGYGVADKSLPADRIQ